jgi:hypothetical protein
LSGKFDFYLSIAHDKGLCALVKRCKGRHMINHHDVYLIFYVKINLEVMSVKKEQKNRIWAPEQKAEIACNHLFGQCCNRRRTPEARPAAVRAAGGFLPVQLPI